MTDATKTSPNNSTSREHQIEENTFETTGHLIRAEDESISLLIALKSLQEIQVAIKESSLQVDELLDLSAEALDDAALSMKSSKKKRKSGYAGDDDRDTDELFEMVRKVALEVLTARRPLLAKSYGVDPAQINIPSSSLSSSSPMNSNNKIETPLVVWASQTGTSMKFALSLSQKMKNVVGTAVTCVNMNDVTMYDISRHKKVYLVCSTFGTGRPPRDGEAFFSSLKSSKDENIFKGVEFAIASLGNSSFEFFAVFGQMLSHEFQAKGAEEIIPVTLVDRREGKRKQKKQFLMWEKIMLSEFSEGYEVQPKKYINDNKKYINENKEGKLKQRIGVSRSRFIVVPKIMKR